MNTNKDQRNHDYLEDGPSIEQVNALQGKVLLEFGTSWCSHCQAAAEPVEKALVNHTNIQHIKVLDGKGKSLGRAFKVKLWPTLILLHKGEEIARVVRPVHSTDVESILV